MLQIHMVRKYIREEYVLLHSFHQMVQEGGVHQEKSNHIILKDPSIAKPYF